MTTGFVLLLLCAYLAGSIPTAVWLGLLVYKADIRSLGSCNAGASNVLRTWGWKPGLFVLVVDVLKGFLPTLLLVRLAWVPPEMDPVLVQILVGCLTVIGHVFPVFARFRGGKGVATAAGMLAALCPHVLLICLLVYAIIVKWTGYSSLASIMATVAFPIGLWVLQQGFQFAVPQVMFLFSLLVLVFMLITHRSNLVRLWRGQENQLRPQKPPSKPD